MKINFFLPKPVFGISGGYKIVYDYAVRLQERGHEVYIYYSMFGCTNKHNIPKHFYYLLEKGIGTLEPRWYKLNNVKKKVIYNIEDAYVKDADIAIATAANTAFAVNELSECKGKKCYLIQDYETWIKGDKYVQDTYRLGMNNITVSSYLNEVVTQYSATKVKTVLNAIDNHFMEVQIPIQKRNPHTICMLYNTGKHKGTKYSIQVINEIKRSYPALSVNCFGSVKRPSDLPNWVHYVEKASRAQVRKLMNHSAIFICSTINEGFGLTGAESMACGCALVTTAYPAVFDYAEDGRNCLMTKIEDVEDMIEKVVFLMEHNERRIEIANNAANDIKKLNWDTSVELFEQILEELL